MTQTILNQVGVPAIDPADPTRLVENDRQLFLAGYYPGLQALTSGSRPEDQWYVQLIEALAAHRLNHFRTVLTFGMTLGNDSWLYPYESSGECCTNQPANYDGWVPQEKRDLDLIDPYFLDYWEDVVALASERGIVVQACIFDGFHTKNNCMINGLSSAGCDASAAAQIFYPLDVAGIDFDFYNGDNNVNGVDVQTTDEWYSNADAIAYQVALVQAIVQRLEGYDNLIWEISNEPADTAATEAWLSTMYQTIRELDDRHLIMPFDLPGHQCVAGHTVPSQSANSENTECTGSGNYDLSDYADTVSDLICQRDTGFVANQPAYYPACQDSPAAGEGVIMPLISDNDYSVCSGELDQLPARQRRKAWVTLVGGGYALLFLYNIESGDPVLTLETPEVQEGMRQIGLTREFIDRFVVDLSGSQPLSQSNESCAPPVNFGTDEQPVWGLQATADGQLAYILYFYGGGTADLTSLQLGGNATATFYNPRSGDESPTVIVDSQVTATDDQDWALLVVDPQDQARLQPSCAV